VAGEADLRELRRWLALEALVTDRPIVLFHLACARLYELRLVRPGLTVMERFLVGADINSRPKGTSANPHE
jgi:hypothetical protein